MNTKLSSGFIFLVTWVVAACATEGVRIDRSVIPRASVGQVAEERIAEINRGKSLEAAYIRELSSAVSQEPRHEIRAPQMEMKIRKAAADLSVGTVKTVTCKTSKCELRLELSPTQSPQAAIEHQRTVDEWIAWSQPCSYTRTGAALTGNGPEVIRIFLNCGE